MGVLGRSLLQTALVRWLGETLSLARTQVMVMILMGEKSARTRAEAATMEEDVREECAVFLRKCW